MQKMSINLISITGLDIILQDSAVLQKIKTAISMNLGTPILMKTSETFKKYIGESKSSLKQNG